MKIGTCPTMLKYAEEISKKNNLEIIPNGSAAEVLYNLNAGNLDIGIIGRKAKQVEFTGYEKRLKNVGYTLIYIEKAMVDYKRLGEIVVHTYLPEDVVKNNFPELEKVVYHNSLEESLNSGEINLINWDDWKDGFDLLIPVDESGNKIEKFRTPILYSKSGNIEEINF